MDDLYLLNPDIILKLGTEGKGQQVAGVVRAAGGQRHCRQDCQAEGNPPGEKNVYLHICASFLH